jgi:hypothetical protein
LLKSAVPPTPTPSTKAKSPRSGKRQKVEEKENEEVEGSVDAEEVPAKKGSKRKGKESSEVC